MHRDRGKMQAKRNGPEHFVIRGVTVDLAALTPTARSFQTFFDHPEASLCLRDLCNQS
jgi:hypothetical protein